MKILKSTILTLFILFKFQAQALVASNRLPLEFVDSMMSKGLWHDDIDNSNSALARDMNKFLDGLQRNEANEVSSVVNNIFNKEFNYKEFQRSYFIKVWALRYLSSTESHGFNRVYIQQVYKSFKQRYISNILSLIKQSKVSGLSSMAFAFEKRLLNKEIEIIDLSKKQRESLDKHFHHGRESFSEMRDGKYIVSGAYLESRNIFLIDFLHQSFDQSIITFTHELIHAVNPKVKKAESDFERLLPLVKDIFIRLCGKDSIISTIDQAFLKNIFFEKDSSRISDFYLQKSTHTLSELKRLLDVETLNDHDLKVIKTWIRAGLDLSVFNEYHAYGLSLSFLKELVFDLNLIRGDISYHQDIVDTFTRGDDYFLSYLAQSQEQFSNLRIFGLKFKSQKRNYLAYKRLIDYLEYFYLDEINSLIKSPELHYSKSLVSLKDLRGDQSRLSDISNDDMNPFAIINTEVSGSSIIKMRNNIDKVSHALKSTMNKLITTKVGILELSDMSLAELKVLGIQWGNADNEFFNYRQGELRDSSLSDIDANILSYFNIVNWDRNIYSKDRNRVYLSSTSLMSNIVKYRMLKVISYLDTIFEPWNNTLLGARVFLSKLDSSLNYNTVELEDIRVKQYEDLLVSLLESSNDDYDVLSTLSLLFDDLVSLHSMADEVDTPIISLKLSQMINLIQGSLEKVGVTGLKSMDELRDRALYMHDSLIEKLKPYKKYCARVDFEALNSQGEYNTRNKFSLSSSESFNLMLSCYKGNLFAVRQPNDFSDHMTLSFSSKGELVAKIMSGSRKVILSPIK